MIKIAMIDDEPNTCEYIASFFGRIGYHVLPVSDPAAAMTVIEREVPQLILLDIVMPQVDGYTILREVKQRYPRTRVVMVSALDDEESREQAFALGADEYVTKPFTDAYLEEVVQKKIIELLSSVRILVVDDEEAPREAIKYILEKSFECDVDTASGGDEAIRCLLAHRGMYDLVLLDVKMPGKSGKDVLLEVSEKRPYLPDIILVTGYDSDQVINQLLQAGAMDYLPKPLDIDLLRKRVKSLLLKRGKLIKPRLD